MLTSLSRLELENKHFLITKTLKMTEIEIVGHGFSISAKGIAAVLLAAAIAVFIALHLLKPYFLI